MNRERLASMKEADKRKLLAALQAREVARCRESFEYFLLKYVRTRDEHDAKNPVKHVPEKAYIRFLAREFQHGPDVQYVAKSRQLMVSWILCAFADWVLLYRPHSRVCFQSKKLEDAAEMIFDTAPDIARASFILNHLPDWLMMCLGENDQLLPFSCDSRTFTYGAIKLPNGARCDALAQGAAQVEGKVPTLFLCDEASLQDEWELAQAAVSPCISNGGRGITVGTMRLPSAYGTEISTAADVDPDEIMRGVAKFKSRSGTPSLRIHYSADPDKDPRTERGAKWFNEETAKMPGGYEGTSFQQHYEINPLSMSGERCIPFWHTIKDKVTIEDIPMSQVAMWSLDSGLDYGARNPTVWLIFANDWHGNRYAVDEISIPANELGGIPGFCKLMTAHPLFHRLNGTIQSDPSLWNVDQNTNSGLVSKAQIFSDNGVYLVKAKTKGQEADDILLNRLKGYYWSDWDDVGFEPKLLITKSCKQLLATIPKWMYREWNDAAQKEHGLQEKMKDRDVDQFDAMKYAEVNRPQPAGIPRQAAPVGSYNWLRNMVLAKQRERAVARS